MKKQAKVILKNGDVLTYAANHVRHTDYQERGEYTDIGIQTVTKKPEYGLFGQIKHIWNDYDFELVAMIKTELIERIDIEEVEE